MKFTHMHKCNVRKYVIAIYFNKEVRKYLGGHTFSLISRPTQGIEELLEMNKVKGEYLLVVPEKAFPELSNIIFLLSNKISFSQLAQEKMT